MLKTVDFAVDSDILRDKRTAFAVFKGKDAQSRVTDALATVDRFVGIMVNLLGKFDVLSNDISRHLTDHSNVLEHIRRPMAPVVENPNCCVRIIYFIIPRIKWGIFSSMVY